MRFAHLSDFHFTTNPSQFPGLPANLPQILHAVVDDLRQIETQLDFIAITGDLSEDGALESYQKLKSLLSVIGIPVLVIPGNHDSATEFGEVFGPFPNQRAPGQLDHYTDFTNARVIGLDSVIYGEVTGKLSAPQLTWLKSALLPTEDPRHTIIMIHHPPFLTHRDEFDALSELDGRAVFAEILKSNQKITLLCGHIHRPYQANWAGAHCIIAGSPANQFSAIPPFGSAPLEFTNEPYSYFLLELNDEGSTVVSTRYF